jgi:ABC-type glycerol-3-phosphate transport system substrate-binding protein
MASIVKFSRRRLLAGAASASALSITSPFIRTAHAAGSLSIGFWDHWVPGANDSLTKLCKEWGEKEKVDVKIDYITSQGAKLQLTAVAEAQAKSGHDILQLTSWDAPNQAKNLVPVDDIVNAAMQKKHDVHIASKIKCQALVLLASIGAVPGDNQIVGILDSRDIRIGRIIIGFIRQWI